MAPGLSAAARHLAAKERGQVSPLSVLRYSMDKRTNLEIVVRCDCQLTEPRIPSTSSRSLALDRCHWSISGPPFRV